VCVESGPKTGEDAPHAALSRRSTASLALRKTRVARAQAARLGAAPNDALICFTSKGGAPA